MWTFEARTLADCLVVFLRDYFLLAFIWVQYVWIVGIRTVVGSCTVWNWTGDSPWFVLPASWRL